MRLGDQSEKAMSQATLDLEGIPPRLLTSAVLSTDRTYRYQLTRRWSDSPFLAWIMLNPSTADENTDDPTIRKCVRWARMGGFGGIAVLNLLALRATDPRELNTHLDPIGPENDRHIAEVVRKTIEQGGSVACAWGCGGTLQGRASAVLRLLQEQGCRPLCLGTTREGQPRHPLYVAYQQALVPLEVAL
jgi:hypothetical protein